MGLTQHVLIDKESPRQISDTIIQTFTTYISRIMSEAFCLMRSIQQTFVFLLFFILISFIAHRGA